MTDPPKQVDLFEYTEEQLLHDHELTHYEILGIQEHASQDAVKKAYRKASLKYHPDKTGRGSEDYVFLAVKAAHDTLFDEQKRQAYDSTTVPFDDSIPPPRATLIEDPMLLYKDEDFYSLFGPVFERNLRFDARLRPDAASKKTQRKKRHGNHVDGKPPPAPELGDEDTPMQQVHAFYEYWIHFESWRDFSAQAADELKVENELENAESRFEKRWIQKEIDKRCKHLKKQEMNRIQTLVTRAMEADPRLRRERQDQLEAKERAKQERERKSEQEKQEAELQKQQQEQREEEEKLRKAEEKVEREKEKKQLRKARQLFRKVSQETYDSTDSKLWEDSYDMNQDVEVLCSMLSVMELQELTKEFEETGDSALSMLQLRAKAVREEEQRADQQAAADAATDAANSEANKATRPPWTKDELSALAKAVKKYPPGGASRWEQISLLVNNICKQDDPRSKEECIEKYNQVARAVPKSAESSTRAKIDSATTDDGDDNDGWTAEQDQQLQDGLAKFPATMDKNERWTSIAKGVTGKTKKECVQRFKQIREALKNRK